MHWGLDSGNLWDPAAWFKVEIENLYVITKDFFRLNGWYKNENPLSTYFPDSLQAKESEKFISNEKIGFLSDRLLRACEASRKLWCSKIVIPGKQESYPSNDEVVRWLMDQDLTFSNDTAGFVARLIRPKFAENDIALIPPDEEQGISNQNIHVHSERLLRACEASLEPWGRECLIPEERDTHPSNQEVIDWLRKKDPSFTKEAAKQVASLIRPSFSEAKGRYSK